MIDSICQITGLYGWNEFGFRASCDASPGTNASTHYATALRQHRRNTVFRVPTGYVYEVGTTVGNYLLADGAAEPIDDDEPSIVLPPEKQLFHPAALAADGARTRANATPFDFEPIAEAADRPPRKRTIRHLKRFPHRRLDARVAALAAEVERIRRDFHDLDPAG
jgi:hypothetical protein